MNTAPTPPVERDASERALRTLTQGVLLDVATALVVAMTAGIAGGIEWTSAYWVALGLAMSKSAVTAVVAYVARILVPPASGGTR